MKSKPSEPARDTITTLIVSPFMLLGLVIAFNSVLTSGVKFLSPVIMIYFAGKRIFPDFNDNASIGFVGAVLNRDLPPYLVIPISSKAKAKGTPPPSMY